MRIVPILGGMDNSTWVHEFHLQFAKRKVQKEKSSVIPVSTHKVSTCQLKGECEELMERPKSMWSTCV